MSVSMMNNRILLLGLFLLSLVSCRDDGDSMVSYVYNDNLAFQRAEYSYAEKFKVFWNGMNTNYALWDYEKQQGLDWNAVYNEYLPKFEALDEIDRTVSDDELRLLMEEMVAPLHDGHLVVKFKNHHTGNYVSVSPAVLRNSQRDDYQVSRSFMPEISYYINTGEVIEHSEASTRLSVLFNDFLQKEGRGMKWVEVRLQQLQQVSTQTASDIKEIQALQSLKEEVEQWRRLGNSKALLAAYNTMAVRYSYMQIPGFDTINDVFLENGIDVKYALFQDHIAYLYIDSFHLSPYLSKLYARLLTGNLDEDTEALMDTVAQVWKDWFSAIQQLHKSGTLKGVVIDLRSNGGGYNSDFFYVLGSLLPSGDYDYAWARFKRGTGRYDYSPLLPQVLSAYSGEHEEISDVPVALLVNCCSGSMSEVSALCAQLMDNGCLVGKRTWGAFCALADNSNYSDNYAGYVGVEDVTPVFCNIPGQAVFTKDGRTLEGIGVTPDIEVAFDTSLYQSTGRDSQLERTLQFIRTGE